MMCDFCQQEKRFVWSREGHSICGDCARIASHYDALNWLGDQTKGVTFGTLNIEQIAARTR